MQSILLACLSAAICAERHEKRHSVAPGTNHMGIMKGLRCVLVRLGRHQVYAGPVHPFSTCALPRTPTPTRARSKRSQKCFFQK